jgi:Peptidase_C39 like family
MRTIQSAAVLVLAVFLSGSGVNCVPPDNPPLLKIPTYAQQTGNWCWAASGQITMNYIRPGTVSSQCEAVSKVVSNLLDEEIDCCKEPDRTKKCLITHDVPPYEEYNFDAEETSKDLGLPAKDRSLSWDEIKRQIYCEKKPFAFSWRWAISRYASGHMMVAVGYKETDGEHLVHFFNPFPRDERDEPVDEKDRFSVRTYEEYLRDNKHVLGQVFYDISFTGGD